jgi:predicted Zn-ribbon and HTH transcriptional regulator
MNDAVILSEPVQKHLCTRCRYTYESATKRPGLCPYCKDWLQKTRLTHCHRKACDDPENPTKFDKVKETKYGFEYHCPKCKSWINFGLLAEVFSVERKKP